MIKRFNPEKDNYIEITQDDYDILDYKLMLISRIMRTSKIKDLENIFKWINGNFYT